MIIVSKYPDDRTFSVNGQSDNYFLKKITFYFESNSICLYCKKIKERNTKSFIIDFMKSLY